MPEACESCVRAAPSRWRMPATFSGRPGGIGMIDETHDRARRSWVDSANGHPEFPLQNLPFGIFSPRSGGADESPPDKSPRGGVAIGDMILDLRAALGAGLFSGEAQRAANAASESTLNSLM